MVKKKIPKQKTRRSLKRKRKFNPLLEQKRLESNGVSGGIVDAYNAPLDAAEDEEAKQNAACMLDLLEAYDIPMNAEDRWYWLAFSLAIDHVPGCQMEAGPRGRKRKWTEEAQLKLYAQVSYKQSLKPGQSASEICSHLAKEYGVKHAALYSQYKKIKSKLTS